MSSFPIPYPDAHYESEEDEEKSDLECAEEDGAESEEHKVLQETLGSQEKVGE